MYISVHSLCHETKYFAQVHPVSTDHPWEVSTTWLESTCGKFSWLDMIRKGTHVYINENELWSGSVVVRKQSDPTDQAISQLWLVIM